VEKSAAPARFQAALQSLQRAQVRPEIQLSEAPAPSRIAPYAVAIDGEVAEPWKGETDPATAQGTFVLLYDPQGQENWDGQFRIVTYLEVQVDRAEAADPILPSVAWTWVTDALGHHPAVGLSGTVSLVTSSSFGELGENVGKSVLQIRASWSATSEQVGPHLGLWAEMLATAGGLERLPSEVTSLEEHREAHHNGTPCPNANLHHSAHLVTAGSAPD